MNIYIYGSNSFKKEIQNVLEHANIKFRLDADGAIEEIDSLEGLKRTIQESPDDIYLIDDEKIITNDSLSNKLSFLRPKDGIEKEFLQEHGIGDVAINSLDKLPKYIKKRLDEVVPQDDIDELDAQDSSEDDYSVSNEELDEIDDIAKSYNENEEGSLSKDDPVLQDLGLEDEDLDGYDDEGDDEIDDELSCLLSADLDASDKDDEEDKEEDDGDLDQWSQGLDEIKEDESDAQKAKNDENSSKNEHKSEEESMSNEYTELDGLSEDDVLSALEELDDIDPNRLPIPKKPEPQAEASSQSEASGASINASSTDIAALIQQLLDNKTLEITIKVKS